MARVLAVDDDVKFLGVLKMLLAAKDYEVLATASSEEALDLLKGEESIDAALFDVRMTPHDGMELLAVAREARPLLPVVMMSAHGSVDAGLAAIRAGAFDYLLKPFPADELASALGRAIARGGAEAGAIAGGSVPRDAYRFRDFVATGACMMPSCSLIDRLARTDVSVVACGEEGSGRLHLCRVVHALSTRSAGPLAVVACGKCGDEEESPERLGEVLKATAAGTVVVRDLELLPPAGQELLLSALGGDREAAGKAARVLATGGTRLEARAREGAFSTPLLQKLGGIQVRLPPLRARREDIRFLAAHFLGAVSGDQPVPGIASDAARALEHYAWPGNVRELRDVVARAASLAGSGQVTCEHLPVEMMRALDGIDFGAAAATDGRGESLSRQLARRNAGALAVISAHGQARSGRDG